MKKKDIVGLVLCLVLTGIIVLLVGCPAAYIPADMAEQLDSRIDQIQIDIESSQEPCKTYLKQDLEMFLDLRGTAQ